MSKSHKDTIDQFTQFVNARHVQHLDQVLEENVEKIVNSKTAYNNIQDAREYYSMEHEACPSAQWKIDDYQQDNLNNNTVKATVLFDNHKYDTTYTFSSAGKIQKIESHLQQQK